MDFYFYDLLLIRDFTFINEQPSPIFKNLKDLIRWKRTLEMSSVPCPIRTGFLVSFIGSIRKDLACISLFIYICYEFLHNCHRYMMHPLNPYVRLASDIPSSSWKTRSNQTWKPFDTRMNVRSNWSIVHYLLKTSRKTIHYFLTKIKTMIWMVPKTKGPDKRGLCF